MRIACVFDASALLIDLSDDCSDLRPQNRREGEVKCRFQRIGTSVGQVSNNGTMISISCKDIVTRLLPIWAVLRIDDWIVRCVERLS